MIFVEIIEKKTIKLLLQMHNTKGILHTYSSTIQILKSFNLQSPNLVFYNEYIFGNEVSNIGHRYNMRYIKDLFKENSLWQLN